MILPTDNDDNKELNDFIPTGFLKEKEMEVMRHLGMSYSTITRIANGLGLDIDYPNMILRQANFIAHSSKSFKGSAFLTMITRQNVQQESFSQNIEQEGQSVLDKLLQQTDSGGSATEDGIFPQRDDVAWGDNY